MVALPTPARSGCPINFGLELFGDSFSLLILRDVLMQGKRRFSEFLASEEGIATNILTARLQRLEQAGLLNRTRASGDRRLVIYSPTEAAIALIPALVELAFWGATHDSATAAPAAFVEGYRGDRAALIAQMTAMARRMMADQPADDAG